MAVYRTTKCPYCGLILENQTPYVKQLIGPPLETCPSCKLQYKTGMKYWKDMDKGEKSWYIVRSIGLFPMTLVVHTILLTFIPGLIIELIFDLELIENYPNLVINYLIFVGVVLSILYVYKIVKDIKHNDIA